MRGLYISNDLKFKDHLVSCDQSLVKQLTTRLNGVILVSTRASFKTRLMIAEGVFMSKLSYLIQLWGGTEDNILRKLQVIQNRAARAVTRLSWFTPTSKLMSQCGWLSVKQLIFYHTAVMIHKIKITRMPIYLSCKVNQEYTYSTRQVTGGVLRFGELFGGKASLTTDSFCYRGTT